MRWQTETSIPDFPFLIDLADQLLLVGSCFAENIGQKLDYFKFSSVQNPFGITYNPLSMVHAIRLIASDKEYDEGDLSFANGRYFSYDHHSRFSGSSQQDVLDRIHASLAEAREKLGHTKVAFISLGTAYYWWLKEEARVVNNCHKQPGHLFEQRRVSVKEVRSALSEVTILLRRMAPGIQVVFTVSPIRHLKHGSAGNQLSKATLIVAAQELAEGLDHVHYFPSYELLLDDLRDYRWYEEDLIHPNKMAIDYIWSKFQDAFFNVNVKDRLVDIEAVRKLLAHRPFQKEDDVIQKLKDKINDRISRLPAHISFEKELIDWSSSLRG